MVTSNRPSHRRVTSVEDLRHVTFVDDWAEVDVPVEALDHLPLVNADRLDSPRLRALMRSMRRFGYTSVKPIVARLGRKGRWVVLDGGHRITAARRVSREFWTNLFHKKVRMLQFQLLRTPHSKMPEEEAESSDR